MRTLQSCPTPLRVDIRPHFCLIHSLFKLIILYWPCKLPAPPRRLLFRRRRGGGGGGGRGCCCCCNCCCWCNCCTSCCRSSSSLSFSWASAWRVSWRTLSHSLPREFSYEVTPSSNISSSLPSGPLVVSLLHTLERMILSESCWSRHRFIRLRNRDWKRRNFPVHSVSRPRESERVWQLLSSSVLTLIIANLA